MFEVKFITHKNCDNLLIDKICNIKKVSWPYDLDMQRTWIDKNINLDDIHVCLYAVNNELIGYANLVHRKIFCENIEKNVYGIGNVCVKYKSMGHGSVLMNFINEWLEMSTFFGILLCKKELINFYSKFNWNVIREYKPSIFLLSYPIEVKNIDYKDKEF